MGECFVRCGAPSNNWSILDFTSEQVCIFNKLYQVYITKRRREEQLNGEAFIRAEVCSEACLDLQVRAILGRGAARRWRRAGPSPTARVSGRPTASGQDGWVRRHRHIVVGLTRQEVRFLGHHGGSHRFAEKEGEEKSPTGPARGHL
jgi:hypothetical protein